MNWGSYNPRIRNAVLLKWYGGKRFKLVCLSSLRLPGYEERDKPKQSKQRGAAHDEKLQSSLSRSRSRIFDLARCNEWDYFITLTLSADKVDRYNLEATYKRLAKWLNNLCFRSGLQLKYLLVPEPHKDGAWHFHGLLRGLPMQYLTPFTLNDHLPQRVLDLLRAGRQIYNWAAYADAFGYVTVEPILDHDRCAAYMTKYITKELGASAIKLNHHLYYCSRGLERPMIVARGKLGREIENPDFQNDYVTTKVFSNPDEALSYIEPLEV